MKLSIILVSIFLTISINSVNSDKILFLSFFSSKSHKNVYDPIINTLAERNHTLTVVSPVKSANSPNIREIVGMNLTVQQNLMGMDEGNVFEMRMAKKNFDFSKLTGALEEICDAYYSLPEVKKLMKEKFDLIIISAMFNDCALGLVYHFQTPFVYVSTISVMGNIAAITGTPSLPSFIPLPIIDGLSSEMTFYQRGKNFFYTLMIDAWIKYSVNPRMEVVYRKHLGNHVPPINEIQKHVSAVLTNSHFTTNYQRPLMPEIVEVGGLHCVPAKPLPKDLEDFVSRGEHGFIYFSLGSIVRAHTMPEEIRKGILSAFSKLKERVIWKWETEEMEDLPPNVKLIKWAPQQDLLGHPHIRLFITHGGLLSTEEAVYHGVPLLGIPMFGDQEMNMNMAKEAGYAIPMDLADINEKSLLENILTLLSEPKYHQTARGLSYRFRDRDVNPLNKAIFWIEYVMRHNGAMHLWSPARNMSICSYYSIDIISTIFLVVALAAVVLFFLLKCIIKKVYKMVCSKMCKKSKKNRNIKKVN